VNGRFIGYPRHGSSQQLPWESPHSAVRRIGHAIGFELDYILFNGPHMAVPTGEIHEDFEHNPLGIDHLGSLVDRGYQRFNADELQLGCAECDPGAAWSDPYRCDVGHSHRCGASVLIP